VVDAPRSPSDIPGTPERSFSRSESTNFYETSGSGSLQILGLAACHRAVGRTQPDANHRTGEDRDDSPVRSRPFQEIPITEPRLCRRTTSKSGVQETSTMPQERDTPEKRGPTGNELGLRLLRQWVESVSNVDFQTQGRFKSITSMAEAPRKNRAEAVMLYLPGCQNIQILLSFNCFARIVTPLSEKKTENRQSAENTRHQTLRQCGSQPCLIFNGTDRDIASDTFGRALILARPRRSSPTDMACRVFAFNLRLQQRDSERVSPAGGSPFPLNRAAVNCSMLMALKRASDFNASVSARIRGSCYPRVKPPLINATACANFP